MKRLGLVLSAAALSALLVPALGFAKGPSEASIEGPGLSGTISLSGSEGSGPLGEVADSSGFYPQVFRQVPDPLLRSRPKGDLGPRYVVTYTVPGPEGQTDLIRQDLYPFAEPSPVSYLAPGQTVFGSEKTYGGWYVSGAQLKEVLVAAGLPRSAPTGDDGSQPPWAVIGALAAVAALGGLVAVALLLLRRRPQPA